MRFNEQRLILCIGCVKALFNFSPYLLQMAIYKTAHVDLAKAATLL